MGVGEGVVSGTVLVGVGRGPTLVGGASVTVMCPVGGGGGNRFGSCAGGAMGVGEGVVTGSVVGRQVGGQPPTLAGRGLVVVVVTDPFGGGGGNRFGSCAGGAMGVGDGGVTGSVVGRQVGGQAPTMAGGVGPDWGTAFWFNVSWRLSGVTHTPSPSKASRHTYPDLQVRGPYAPPPGWRRLAAVAFSCATSVATCWVTHT
jgi:hypothetical protein